MKKFSLLFLLPMFFCQAKAQDSKDQQKVKDIALQAYESVSQSTRQWFADASAQHPPGEFDTAFAILKLKEKFALPQLTGTGDILMVMMAYQKMLAKEARDDRKVGTHLKKLLLASKAEKIKLDNETIDQQMKEAREKANIAMDNATISLITGIVGGSIQIAAASMSFQGNQNTPAKDSVKQKIKITPIKPLAKSNSQLSLALYIKKLEKQLAILKKEKNQ